MFKKVKIDVVMCIAWLLAAVSAFFVHPDREYIGYIDFRSLGILWGLMVIIQGFKANGLFEKTADALLAHVSKGRQLSLVLIFICFVGGMFITNDVALITFVPLSIMMLRGCGREDIMIPVIVLQTIAANLGSMLTPIGNPQNLYLYGLTGMPLTDFLLLMLPYSLVSAVLLLISVFLLPGQNKPLNLSSRSDGGKKTGSLQSTIIYAILFVIAFLSVLRVIPWYILAAIVFVAVLCIDRKLLLKADYVLLLTFIGFFIFTGNMSRIPVIRDLLNEVIGGREFYAAVLSSQVISNVPAALLLSSYTTNYNDLIIGVNAGGLGTLIASMASLISYKAYVKEYKGRSLKYIAVFTGFNVCFLAVMIVVYNLLLK